MTASLDASNQPLIITRRLAIQLLHVAQVAAPLAIEGIVVAEGDEPVRYLPRAQAEGQAAWAQVFSNPTAPAVPETAQLSDGLLTLMISLDIKGVLELRAWTLSDGAARERVISIRD